jgi:hypothetical protein
MKEDGGMRGGGGGETSIINFITRLNLLMLQIVLLGQNMYHFGPRHFSPILSLQLALREDKFRQVFCEAYNGM